MPFLPAVLLAAAASSGCLWRSYESILEVHLTVLAQMTEKLASMAEAGRAPTAADVVELTYPAQRARGFLRQFRRDSERSSYRGFLAFVERYEALLKRVDAARTTPEGWRAERELLRRDRADLLEMAAGIRRDL